MRRIVLALCLLAMTVSVAYCQTAPSFSHGPSIPFATVSWDKSGDAHAGMLTAGAGYSLNWNLLPSQGGAVRWLNLGFPVFVRAVGSDFSVAQGVTVGTLNNLLAVGVSADLVNVDGEDRGLFLDYGSFGKQDVRILFAFGFNVGGGSPPAVAGKRAGGTAEPPPCYVKLPWQ